MQPQDPRNLPAVNPRQPHEDYSPPPSESPPFWSTREGETTILVVVAALLTITLAIVFAYAYLRGPSSASTPLVTRPPVTESAGPTATPVPQTIGDTATVGGTWGGFETAYGPLPDSTNRTTWVAQIGGQPVLITVHFSSRSDSADGQERVLAVSIHPPAELLGQETWDPVLAEAFARTFLPADATVKANGSDAHGDVIHEFMSPLLASTFAPHAGSIFTNSTFTQSVAPGSVNFVCVDLVATGSNHPDDCEISVGT